MCMRVLVCTSMCVCVGENVTAHGCAYVLKMHSFRGKGAKLKIKRVALFFYVLSRMVGMTSSRCKMAQHTKVNAFRDQIARCLLRLRHLHLHAPHTRHTMHHTTILISTLFVHSIYRPCNAAREFAFARPGISKRTIQVSGSLLHLSIWVLDANFSD